MKKFFTITLATIVLTTTLGAAALDDIVFSDTRSAEDAALFPSKTDQFIIVDIDDNELITRGTKMNADWIKPNQLEDYAQTVLKRQLALHQITLNQLPKDKQQLLTVSIKNLCTQCQQQCKKSKTPGIKKQHFNTLLKAVLEKIYNRVPAGYVVESGLAKAIDSIITARLKSAGIAMIEIPTDMKGEFTQRRNGIIVKIKQLMLSRKTDHVALNEIEDVVSKAFDAFIDRIQHVFVWDWVNTELVYLNKDNKAEQTISSLKKNPASKKLRDLALAVRNKN